MAGATETSDRSPPAIGSPRAPRPTPPWTSRISSRKGPRSRAMRNLSQLGGAAEPAREGDRSLAAQRTAYATLLRESLDRIVASLAALDAVVRVSVFGSDARGRADLGTDLAGPVGIA